MAGKIYYQNSCDFRYSGVYLVFEVFQEREFKEMLAISYLVLQACISFLRCFRQERCISAFALFAQDAVAHAFSTCILDLLYSHPLKPTFDPFLTYINVFGVSGLLGRLCFLTSVVVGLFQDVSIFLGRITMTARHMTLGRPLGSSV